ncbi:MAG: thiamine phosphate synthase [Planctomycetota bacterium]|nr:thiamine phosphate synthase [Planctomycetota bacterium]
MIDRPHHPARILDASANRAREGLRVLEDAARFLLDDRALTAELKGLRHQLLRLIQEVPQALLDGSRAVESDEGRTVTAPGEFIRADSVSVIRAASSRVSESLRSLEEWSKTVRPDLASGFEQLRYRVYQNSQDLITRLARPSPQWRVCLLLTERTCRTGWRQVLEGAIEGGVDCIQIREKELSDQALFDRIRRTIEVAHPRGVSVVVNDRLDLALAAGADGVHLGQGDLPLSQARDLAAERLLIGISTHDPGEAADAIRGGCDLVGVGAIFPTRTKQDLDAAGLTYFERFLASHPGFPHLAIGGIDVEGATRLAKIGCRGVAVSAAICGADDPLAAARGIVEAMNAGTIPNGIDR